MERIRFNPDQTRPEEMQLPEQQSALPQVARVVDEPGTEEYFDGNGRLIEYPLNLVEGTVNRGGNVDEVAKVMLEIDHVTNDAAFYRMPEHCITLKSAAVENMHAENNRAMIEVWKRLGALLGSLPADKLPDNLSLSQILIDQDTGEIRFLPTVKMQGASTIVDIATKLQAEYASSMLDASQKQKLKNLAANLLRSAASSDRHDRQ